MLILYMHIYARNNYWMKIIGKIGKQRRRSSKILWNLNIASFVQGFGADMNSRPGYRCYFVFLSSLLNWVIICTCVLSPCPLLSCLANGTEKGWLPVARKRTATQTCTKVETRNWTQDDGGDVCRRKTFFEYPFWLPQGQRRTIGGWFYLLAVGLRWPKSGRLLPDKSLLK